MFDHRETRGKREVNRSWSSKSLKYPTLDHSCGCLLGPLVSGSANNYEKRKNRNVKQMQTTIANLRGIFRP